MNLSSSFCSAGDNGQILLHVIFGFLTRSMAWSYGLCCGSLSDANLESR